MNSTSLYTILCQPNLQHSTITATTTNFNDTTMPTTTGGLTTREDHHGAMVFTVATVCVYGLSIVFFIAGHLQKGQVNKDEENQISRYLKRLHMQEPSKVDRRYLVVRYKSQVLAESMLGQRHHRRASLLPPSSKSRARHRGPEEEEMWGEGGGECEEEGEWTASHGTGGPCHVHTVSEQPRSSRRPPPRSRARRGALLGASGGSYSAVGDGGSSSGSGSNTIVDDGGGARKGRLKFPSIEEDALSLNPVVEDLTTTATGGEEDALSLNPVVENLTTTATGGEEDALSLNPVVEDLTTTATGGEERLVKNTQSQVLPDQFHPRPAASPQHNQEGAVGVCSLQVSDSCNSSTENVSSTSQSPLGRSPGSPDCNQDVHTGNSLTPHSTCPQDSLASDDDDTQKL